jgi:hypothetical protein
MQLNIAAVFARLIKIAQLIFISRQSIFIFAALWQTNKTILQH